MHKLATVLSAGVAAVALAACGSDAPRSDYSFVTPGVAAASESGPELAVLRSSLEQYPEYSIILHGLRPEGDSAFHQYKLVWRDSAATEDSLRAGVRYTDWTPITRSLYQREQPVQGMAVLVRRPGGQVLTEPMPPVLAYVGDDDYGQWETLDGSQQWVFSPEYALMAELLDEIGDLAEHKMKRKKKSSTPVVVVPRSAYDAYRAAPATYRNTYQARYTQHASANPVAAGRPNFMERARVRQAISAGRFDDKVRSRMGTRAATPAASASPRTASTPSRTGAAGPPAPAYTAGTARPAASGSYSSRPSTPPSTRPAYTPSSTRPSSSSSSRPSYGSSTRPSSSSSRSSGSYSPSRSSGSSSSRPSSSGSSRSSSGRRRP